MGANGFVRGTTLASHYGDYSSNLACLPNAAELLEENHLPMCEVHLIQKKNTHTNTCINILGHQTSSITSPIDTRPVPSNTQGIAIAGLVLACLALVVVPAVGLALYRQQRVAWMAQAQTAHVPQKDFDQER